MKTSLSNINTDDWYRLKREKQKSVRKIKPELKKALEQSIERSEKIVKEKYTQVGESGKKCNK